MKAPDTEASSEPAPASEPGKTAAPGSTPDQRPTDPAPESPSAPEDPSASVADPPHAAPNDGSFAVTLTVRCDTVLNNMNLLAKEKHVLVPADGVIFPATTVTAYEGESAFNVLQRTMKQAKIHLTFRSTPIYNSAYIEDINNLYEFDAGELSGWLYCVNGRFPSFGCSRYQVQPGDVIAFHYTCDSGRDLGQGDIAGGQKDD